MRGKSQHVARPAQMRRQNSGYWTKVHQNFIRRRRFIGGVNDCIHGCKPPIRCAMPAQRMKVGYANFQQKSSDPKKVRLIMPTHMHTYHEYFVNIKNANTHCPTLKLDLTVKRRSTWLDDTGFRQFYLPPTRLSINGMSHPAFIS